MRSSFRRAAVAALVLSCVASGLCRASTFTVTSAANAGAGTLRQAIIDANAHPGFDTIAFNLPGGGVRTILLTAALPDVTEAATFDGTTQPGYVSGGQPFVVLNGGAVATGNGLTIRAGCTILALTIQEFDVPPGPGVAGMVGVLVDSAASNTFIEGCYIGTSASGTGALGNYYGVYSLGTNTMLHRCVISGNGEGVYLRNGTATIVGCKIGTNAAGTAAVANTFRGIATEAGGPHVIGSAAEPNVISGNGPGGNGSGIELHTAGDTVKGNRIGTNAAGTGAVPNGLYGVEVYGAGCTIGGSGGGEGNVISGNTLTGVYLRAGASNAVVAGNTVGANAAGTAAIPNGQGGVLVESANAQIGLTVAGGGNVISGNTGSGVRVNGGSSTSVRGNLIGLNAGGTGAVPNSADGVAIASGTGPLVGDTVAGARNVISGNGGYGVSIAQAAPGTWVLGNWIGTNSAGTGAVGNSTGGVRVDASGVQIGGAISAAGNVISGNPVGIVLDIHSGGVSILRNFIGTNAAGTATPTGLVAGANVTGVRLLGGSGHVIGASGGQGNLISGHTSYGVEVVSIVNTITIQANAIGTNGVGTAAIPNGIAGIFVGTPYVTIGGPTAPPIGTGNVISGNGVGIILSDTSTQALVRGNRIGTNAAGTAAIPNTGEGIRVSSAGHQIGPASVGAAPNVISGNGGDGIRMTSSVPGNFVAGVTVFNNLIGTDPTGTLPLGNGGAGVACVGPSVINCAIGVAPASGNVIAANAGAGVLISGTAGVTPSTGVAIEANSIHDNGGLGIDLSTGAAGVTPNDAGDGDDGPNGLQNFPVLTGALILPGGTRIRGTLSSKPSTAYHVEFFSSAACDPSGNGEGRTFLGSASVATDALGVAVIDVTVTAPVSNGEAITATAEDPSIRGSEFSACVTAHGPWYVRASATGANTGLSWADAFTDLQSALGAAQSGNEIWVGAGTYKPTATTDRAATFTLRSGVGVYGGFAAGGGETLLSQRNPVANPAVLSGDIGVVGVSADNTIHIVTAPQGTDSTAVLDSFTITLGNGGAAVLIDRSALTVAGCTFLDNTPAVSMIEPAATTTFTRCAWIGNHNGAVSTSKISGGNGGTAPVFTNCLIAGNTSAGAGAIASLFASGTTFRNCTIAGNTSGVGSAFVFTLGSSACIFQDSVVWGNSSPLFPLSNGIPSATYTDIQTGLAGVGNINADPRFVDPDGPDQTPGTLDDDYRLGPGSPCIDAGFNGSVPAGTTTDLAGAPRIVDAVLIFDTGFGDPPNVDLGCYEAPANTPRCAADFDSSGSVNPADVAGFINAWSASLTAGTLAGDFDHNGAVNPADVAAFINAWSAAVAGGC